MNPTDGSAGRRLDDLLPREWLITNHLGGYASSTIPCLNTRKYHGLLVAAMAPPVRRLVLLSRVEETVTCDGWPTPLACNEYPGTIHPQGHESLRAFSTDPFPRWAYQGDGWSLEKSLQLLRGQNTVVLTYTLVGAHKPLTLELRPLLALRPIHELMYQWNGRLDAEEKSAGHHRVPPTSRTPEVFFAHDGGFQPSGTWYFNTIYRCEQGRGYGGLEDLWSPGVVKWTLAPGASVHFVCSAEPVELGRAVAAAELECAQLDVPLVASPARDTDHDLLVHAAEAFAPELPADALARTPALVTHFPWSPPGVRDSLIALPGVLLVTGKFEQAKAVLLGLAGRLRSGLIPSEFPEDGGGPTYAGADTALWFVNAVYHYLRYTGDEPALMRLLGPAVMQIVTAYQLGAAADVSIDAGGLLATTAPGATWMAAAAHGTFATPRVGRPVELNALWYNAVRIAAELSDHAGQSARARDLSLLADKVAAAFNRHFWNDAQGCCFDLLGNAPGDNDAADASVRPNQLLALSLPFPVLWSDRHAAVLERVRRDLLTPVGLRTLAPGGVRYRGHYGGDEPARAASAHNGTIYPWLLGPFVCAWLRVFGRGEAARSAMRGLLRGCLDHMGGDGLGQLCELFDGDAPHRPGGATASAPAVGELLRCYVEDILDLAPRGSALPSPGASATAAPGAILLSPHPTVKR